ncbi:MAG: hypothetical protein KGP27_03135, partial [Hyphomicrobiales bacterium]|nr:hypothetical protein [Hyphomicrobiales bacterium]
ALDEKTQERLMELFKTDLYEASVISVTNSPTVARYHERQIELSRAASSARLIDRLRQQSAWQRMREAMSRRRKVKS